METDALTPEDPHAQFDRRQAARETIELFVLNLCSIRRADLPVEARARIREIIRLGRETVEILQRTTAGSSAR